MHDHICEKENVGTRICSCDGTGNGQILTSGPESVLGELEK